MARRNQQRPRKLRPGRPRSAVPRLAQVSGFLQAQPTNVLTAAPKQAAAARGCPRSRPATVPVEPVGSPGGSIASLEAVIHEMLKAKRHRLTMPAAERILKILLDL